MATNINDQLKTELKAARALLHKAISQGRELNDDDQRALEGHKSEIDRLATLREQVDESAALMKGFDAYDPAQDPEADGAMRANSDDNRGMSFKGVASRLVRSKTGSPLSVKALISTGQVTETQDLDLTVLKERAPVSFLESIPVQRGVSENFSYLRQVTRTNNAAPVAVGGTKPTSVYTLQRIDAKLEVVAHLSEAVPEYWIADNSSLEQFVKNELQSGLMEAIAVQALNGTGVSPSLTGLTTASGIQLVAFTTDALTTLRKAITALESASLNPYLVVMNPTEWEKIELTRENGATGGYLLGSQGQLPIDRAKRQVWGVPVALSTAVPTGAAAPAYVLAEGSVKLFTDGKVSGAWGIQNDDFAKNQVRARLETRAQMGVLLPAGIVKATITA